MKVEVTALSSYEDKEDKFNEEVHSIDNALLLEVVLGYFFPCFGVITNF